MSPGSLSFAKLVMMSSAPAKSAGDARYAFQDSFRFVDRSTVPYKKLKIEQSRLQTVLGVRSFYVERNKIKEKTIPFANTIFLFCY